MKKLGVLIILTLLLLSPALAQLGTPGEEIAEKISEEGPEGAIEELRNQTLNKTDYLKREWAKILEDKPVIGPTMKFFDTLFNHLNPVFKVVLGVNYGFSWAFIFAIAIWIILITILYHPAKELFNGKLFGILAGIIIASLIGIAGTIRWAVDLLSTILTQTWIIWVSLLVAIIIGVILNKLSGELGGIVAGWKKEAEKELVGRAGETIKTHGKVSGKALETFDYKRGMRRGGSKSTRGRFVSKKSTERYARRFGSEAAAKRFKEDI
jgi:hypothetical protein